MGIESKRSESQPGDVTWLRKTFQAQDTIPSALKVLLEFHRRTERQNINPRTTEVDSDAATQSPLGR